MGYPDVQRSNWYVPVPAFAIILGLVLSAVLPIVLMLRT